MAALTPTGSIELAGAGLAACDRVAFLFGAEGGLSEGALAHTDVRPDRFGPGRRLLNLASAAAMSHVLYESVQRV